MSLIHWWPLNGNTNDLGLNPISLTNNGATVDNNGKIGKCYYFDGNDDYLQATIEAWLFGGTGHPFSITFWMKFTDDLIDRKLIFGNYSLTTPYFNIEMSYGSTAYNGRMRFCWSAGCDYWFTVATGVKDVWQHYAITYDGINKISLYKDGAFIESTTATLNAISSGIYYLGRDGRTGSTALKGYLNDFRIYDHALSVKEVKEISKGLVLHYTFEDEYIEPTTNLSSYSNIGGWNNSGAASYSQNDTNIANVPCPDCKVLSITQTTAGQSAGTFGTTSSNVPSKTLTASVWFYMSGTHTGSSNIGPYIRSNKTDGNIGNLEYNGSTAFRTWPNNQWIKLTKTFTTNSEATTVYFCCYTANADEKFAFNGWQIEEKDHATPWTKNGSPRSSEKVYDNSGYGNNGTVTGSPQIVSDSGSGSHSMKFDGNTLIKANGLTTEAKTAIVWYKGAKPSDSRVIFADEGSKLAMGFYNNGSMITSSQSDLQPYYSVSTYDNSGWNCLAVVKGNGNNTSQLYINGVAATRTGTDQWWTHSGGLWIGGRSAGSNITGQIGDIKIYSTALSADDVKAEYNRKASIDRNGNLFTGEIVETSSITSPKIDKNNFVSASTISEGLMTKTLSDGAVFERIYFFDYDKAGSVWTTATAKSCNTAGKFSVLGSLNSYIPTDGWYEFYYRENNNWVRWKQSYNPLSRVTSGTSGTSSEYTYIGGSANPYSSFSGLTRYTSDDSGSCYLRGAPSWWCAIAPYQTSYDVFPDMWGNSTANHHQELWIRIDNLKAAPEFNDNDVKLNSTGVMAGQLIEN